ncbi:MAG: nitrile hydratase subunit beta [Chloroflexi bacterium]|nr:nitrile hydratase subunit beta [Chloroflexota bacterium]
MSDTPNLGISAMTGDGALPRKNGELVFNEPWEGRAFGLAAALTENGVHDWSDFRDRLIEVAAGRGEHGGETG